MRTWGRLIAFMMLSLLSKQSWAGLDAVELDLVPSDILVDCNRSFFKSSDPEVKSLFVTPHVVAGRSPIDGDGLQVHIFPTPEPGKYIFSVGVFFPRDAEDAINSYELRDAQANFCNFESVLHYINKGIAAEEDKFQEMVHLPLTSAEIRIANLNIEAHVIGRTMRNPENGNGAEDEEVDILEYNDNSYTAEFVINDHELDYINSHMSTDEGLQLDIKYRFESRKKDGAIYVNMDGSKIAANFQAAANGQKYLVKAEVQAHLQSSISAMDIEIDVKAGKSDSFKNVVDKIIDQVLANVKFEGKPEDAKSEALTPTEKKALEVVEVKVVVDYLTAKSEFHFDYSESTLPSSTTAQTTARVKSDPIDPFLAEIVLRDGFDNGILPDFVKKGETIKITPAYSYIARREWKERISYLTKSQLNSLGVYEMFPLTKSSQFAIDNYEIMGQWMAEGEERDYFGLPKLLANTFRWRRIQRFPVRTRRAKIRNYDIRESEDLKSVPASIAFSQVGGGFHRWTLDELLTENEYWIAKLEFGTVVLTAKQDLGQPTFRIHSHRPYYDQLDKNGNRLYPHKNDKCTQMDKNKEGYCEYLYDFRVTVRALDEVVQEEHCGFKSNWGLGCEASESKPIAIKGRVDGWALDMYQAVHLMVTRPQVIEPWVKDDSSPGNGISVYPPSPF